MSRLLDPSGKILLTSAGDIQMATSGETDGCCGCDYTVVAVFNCCCSVGGNTLDCTTVFYYAKLSFFTDSGLNQIIYDGVCYNASADTHYQIPKSEAAATWPDASEITEPVGVASCIASECPSCNFDYLSTLPTTITTTLAWSGFNVSGSAACEAASLDPCVTDYNGYNFTLTFNSTFGTDDYGKWIWNQTPPCDGCTSYVGYCAKVILECFFLTGDCTLQWKLSFLFSGCSFVFYSPVTGATSGGSPTPIGLTYYIENPTYPDYGTNCCSISPTATVE